SVEHVRLRGRPAGPAINDWPALQEAAAIWREQGGRSGWRALIEVGKHFRGETETTARRLLFPLRGARPGWGQDDFERAGILDFRCEALVSKLSWTFRRDKGREMSDSTLATVILLLEEY